MTTTSSMATWPSCNLRRRCLDEFKNMFLLVAILVAACVISYPRLHSLTQSDQRAFPKTQLKLMDMQ